MLRFGCVIFIVWEFFLGHFSHYSLLKSVVGVSFPGMEILCFLGGFSATVQAISRFCFFLMHMGSFNDHG